jgi:hypothetical protein
VGLAVANLLHSSINGIVRRFVLLLPMSSHHIRRLLNDVDPVVGDVAVKIGNLLACLHDCLSEQLSERVPPIDWPPSCECSGS